MQRVVWLHFVGKKYWKTPRKFIKEALKFGVSRRITASVLRKMSWGDVVVLAQWDGKKSIAFGYFTVEGVMGDIDVSSRLRELGHKSWNETETYIPVSIGCGEYVITKVAKTDAAIVDVVEAYRQLKNTDNPFLMVSGPFHSLNPWIIFKDIPHRQGFRQLDWSALVEAISHAKKNKAGWPILHGQFYCDSQARSLPDLEGKVIQVSNYEPKGGGK